MTSSVMSIWAGVTTSFIGSATYSLSVPNASEWRRTRTVPTSPRSSSTRSIWLTTSARLSGSAAFTLKNTASWPSALISLTIRSTLPSVALRSRWTPKMFSPARASARLVASPNPDDAPSASAQPLSWINASPSRGRPYSSIVESLGAMPKTAGIILVGNEILSGKIADSNAAYLCRELRALGVDVRRIAVIPDEIEVLAREVAAFSRDHDVVFTSGGVGPTHDDVTIEGVARAMDVKVVRHPLLVGILERHFRDRLNESHLKMAETREGAELVGGETVRFPTVLIRNVYILPGVPEVFRQKFEAIRERFRDQPIHLKNVFVAIGEGTLADYLNRLLVDFPLLLLGSYPEFSNPEYKVKVTLESRDRGYLEGALAEFLRRLPNDALVKVT